MCIYIKKRNFGLKKIRNGLQSELRFNVPDLLKSRAFAPTVCLYLEGIISCKCYLFSFMRNSKQPYSIALLVSVSELYLLQGTLLPSASGAGALYNGAEADLTFSLTGSCLE